MNPKVLEITELEREEAIQRIVDKLIESDRFLICGHVRPDGDCVGSQMGLFWILREMGKSVRVYNPGPVAPGQFDFVPGIEHFSLKPHDDFQQDVVIYLDCGNVERLANGYRPAGFVINIDHHLSNALFADINWVNSRACAVGEMIYDLLERLPVELTPAIASCLYLAIIGDTGSFRYSNTNARTFEIAGDLVAHGADPARIAEGYFENRSPQSVWLAGQVLSNLHYEFDGKLVWGEITREMYERVGGPLNEPDSLVGEMRSIRGVEVAILMHGLTEEEGLRAGFRSKGRVNVALMASEMDGGGHHNAAGCYVTGDYEAIKERLLCVARKYFADQSPATGGNGQ
ncbi:MAG: bifunctional oligoribonuclease/PAP phosphatase NrnA [Candidatus Sumerlaeia bacterium]